MYRAKRVGWVVGLTRQRREGVVRRARTCRRRGCQEGRTEEWEGCARRTMATSWDSNKGRRGEFELEEVVGLRAKSVRVRRKRRRLGGEGMGDLRLRGLA